MQEYLSFIEDHRKNYVIVKNLKDATVYNPSNLNEKQKVAYKMLKKWTLETIDNTKHGKDPQQLLLHINGKAGKITRSNNMNMGITALLVMIFLLGCGKSFWLEVFKSYLATKKKELHGNFLKIAAPTGKPSRVQEKYQSLFSIILFLFFTHHLKEL